MLQLGFRRSLTALVVLAVLLPAGVAWAQPAPEDELERVQGELSNAREDLAEIENRQDLTLADLERSDARRRELEAELALREDELAAAEAELAAAEAALAQTTRQLLETRRRLADTRIRLAETREDFRARARASYMYGGSADAPGQLLEVRDVSQFQRALGYVEAVLNGDRAVVESVEELEAQIDRDAEVLDGLQRLQDEQRESEQAQRDEVAVLVEQTRALKAEADAEVERHQAILAQLEADEQSHQALIASLDAESGRLEAELRARAEAAEAAARRSSQNSSQSSSQNSSQGSAAPAGPPPASSGRFQRPCDCRQGSGFGPRVHPIFGSTRMHTGIDFGAPSGAAIYAAEDGVVVSASVRGGYGNATVVDHGGGITTLYAHQSRFGVSAGERVSRGQHIGYVGSTGYSTGPHLHFEVRVNGSPVNPAPYL